MGASKEETIPCYSDTGSSASWRRTIDRRFEEQIAWAQLERGPVDEGLAVVRVIAVEDAVFGTWGVQTGGGVPDRHVFLVKLLKFRVRFAFAVLEVVAEVDVHFLGAIVARDPEVVQGEFLVGILS